MQTIVYVYNIIQYTAPEFRVLVFNNDYYDDNLNFNSIWSC